jgi:hypothetical protein
VWLALGVTVELPTKGDGGSQYLENVELGVEDVEGEQAVRVWLGVLEMNVN